MVIPTINKLAMPLQEKNRRKHKQHYTKQTKTRKTKAWATRVLPKPGWSQVLNIVLIKKKKKENLWFWLNKNCYFSLISDCMYGDKNPSLCQHHAENQTSVCGALKDYCCHSCGFTLGLNSGSSIVTWTILSMATSLIALINLYF